MTNIRRKIICFLIVSYCILYTSIAQFPSFSFPSLPATSSGGSGFPSLGSPPSFGSAPPPPPTTATPPTLPSTTNVAVATFITPSVVLQDRLSRTFEPNVFNSGSESMSLNEALTFYTNEQYRILHLFNELTIQKTILDGSPRSLADPNMDTYYKNLNTRLDKLAKALQVQSNELSKIKLTDFDYDLRPMEISEAAANPIPAFNFSMPEIPEMDLPKIDPAILMNPEVQEGLKKGISEWTDIFGGLKDLFTPDASTSSAISSIVSNAPKPSASKPSKPSGGGLLEGLSKLFGG